MADFQTYLNAFQAARGFKSDADMARSYDFSRTNMSKIRHHGHATNELCLEIAEKIGVEDYIVLAARNAAKETGPVGEAWKRLLAKVALVVMTIAAALLLRDYDMGEGEFLLSFQALTSLKDYRNFMDLHLIQALTLLLIIMPPVIHKIGNGLRTNCNAF